MKSCCGKGPTCPLTGCPIAHILVLTVIAFAFSFGFDFLYHGTVMKEYYEVSASMWRPESEMEAYFPFCLLYHGVVALGVAGLYAWGTKGSACCGKSLISGLRFGLLIGLVLGINDFAAYIWLPFEDMDIPLHWFVGRVIWGVLLGILLSLTMRCLRKEKAE